MGGTRFMVQWEEHPSHLATRLGQLLEHQTLVDVTLMCNTHTLRVHRAVLAACSPYFETILQRQLGMYPLIVLKDMQFSVLKSLIEFMYCGETSVTEDNLSALLQAAKFFQVKGLSAMTREALGLTPTAPRTVPANSTVNGETARKGFVGRSKRVGVQQTLVSSGLKTVSATSHIGSTAAAVSQTHGVAEAQPTQAIKTVFQTAPKSVQIRTESQQQQQQQQTDTAQLLLSLSGSEFPKQTFHTVSKNVRFHHNVSTPGAVTVEPSRTCPIESTVIKNKDTIPKSEMIDRVPVITPNGGVKAATVVLPTAITEKPTEPVVDTGIIESVKDELTSQQVFYMDETTRKRGRPLKRQMNIMFKEKVLTDAEMALQKEAEASRKALEMLQQEMSTGDEMAVSTEEVQPQKHGASGIGVSKLQTSPLNSAVASPSQRVAKETAITAKAAPAKAEVPQVSTVSTSQSTAQNVIYQVAGSSVPGIDSNNETNIVYQLEGGNILGQDGAANIVYQVADNTVMAGQDANGQNIIYQVADSTVPSGEGNSNSNVIYQVADGNNTPLMTQYMEALKEAGLPSDVPILLESGDGSYVSVNEEILMNIMNGGMIQVADGSLVGGENVQFIVQEVQEVPEGQEATAEAPAEQQQQQQSSEMETSAVETTETESSTVQETEAVQAGDSKTLEPESSEPNADIPQSACGDEMLINQTMEDESILPSLADEPEEREVPEVKGESMQVSEDSEHAKQLEDVEDSNLTEEVSACVDPTHPPIAPTHSDEIITGDSYGQEAMEGFAVMESNERKEDGNDTPLQYKEDSSDFSKEASTNDFDQESSNEKVEIRAPEKESKVDTTSNAGMSVEQALQAMMGESSDTEMEVCTNVDTHQDAKVKPDTLQQDTKGHGTNDASTDEETEDLRLVLSPEDESGKSSINDSFTLALSSPDSSVNEKVHSEMEVCVESSQDSQADKQAVDENEDKTSTVDSKDLKNEEQGASELELVLSTDYNPTSQQAVESEEAVAKDVEDASSEMQTCTKEAEMETVDSTAPESEVLEADSSVSVEGSTVLITDPGSVDISSGDTESIILQKQIVDISSGDTEGIILQKQIELSENIDESKDTEDISGTAEVPTGCSEIDTSSNVIPDNDADSNTDYSGTTAGKSLPILTDNDAETIPDYQPVVSEMIDNAEDKDSTWLEPSSTEPEILDSENKQENDENIASSINVNESISEDYSLSSTSPAHSDSLALKSQSLQEDVKQETESGDKVAESLPETIATSTEPCDANIIEQHDNRLEFEEYDLKDKTEADVIEKMLAKTVKTNVLDEEAMADEELELSAEQSGLEAKVEFKDGSKVASPVKDIPYAVGLLPLKTALEKLQAMPEHHPRKTRSASSSKESCETPGVRLKRKASASSEGVEKKQKTSDGDEADTSSDGGIMLSTTDDSDELGDANTSLESVPEDDVSNLIIMSEEPIETEKDKEDVLPSVMDLVNEPHDSL